MRKKPCWFKENPRTVQAQTNQIMTNMIKFRHLSRKIGSKWLIFRLLRLWEATRLHHLPAIGLIALFVAMLLYQIRCSLLLVLYFIAFGWLVFGILRKEAHRGQED